MKNKILLGVSGVKGVKTIVFLFLCLLMILPLSSCYNKENREEILKVYNWADYIDEDVLANFPKWYEQQTGKKIRVIYQTFVTYREDGDGEVIDTHRDGKHETGNHTRQYLWDDDLAKCLHRRGAQLYQQSITIHC